MNSKELQALKRKASKPLTEKRRRERINNRLSDLKTLVLRGTNKEDNVKLEKADIMEMTVRYIEDIQQKQTSEGRNRTQLVMNSFIRGYATCINDVSTSLSANHITNDVRSSVSNHLATSYSTMTTGLQTHEPHASIYSSDRLATSTPYSNLSTKESHPYQLLSPIIDTNPQYSSSCDTLSCNDWSSTYSASPSVSPTLHSPSDSGVDGSTGDNSVWRPW
ncbi:transcription factor HES-1-like [Mytilus galloprovincialis]|uniref:transcription factor HES-1-A-like n=1 Tax=Mytilus edulis TaxID=6550 RepID=UPI0039F0283D